jgi:predicted Fe-Mo cluster-binding NifX family protein
MKLCIPSLGEGGLDADVSPHFGRAPTFTMYETETEAVEVVENDGKHRGGSEAPPVLIAREGADALVCANLGRKAVDRFCANDIEVYSNAAGTVREAIQAWEAGELTDATTEDEPCGHDDHGHEHGH